MAGAETRDAAVRCGTSVLWRRLDVPGHDAVRLEIHADGSPTLQGAAVFAEGGRPCRLDYAVDGDAEWRTRRAAVFGWVGDRRVEVEVTANADGVWRLGGKAQGALAGCADLDLAFTPATNTLPIRRLGLAVGDEAETTVAWLRFPEMTLEPLAQTYRRDSETAYRFEAPGLGFVAELYVDENGLVRRYQGLWEAEG